MAHLAHYKQAHPIPFVITHWINLVCMVLLIFTGFLIHFPFWAALTGVARGLHVFCGIVWVTNAFIRVVLAFFIQTAPTGGTRNLVKDYKTWLPQADNKNQLIPWIKYYLFMKKDHPLSAKLGVPQKLAYLAVGAMIFVMAYTGFCLWIPTSEWTIFAIGVDLVGGMMSMRIIHYFLMFFFIIFSFIHIYLVFIEGTAPAKLMLFHKEHGGAVYNPETHTIVGEDHSIDHH